MHKPTMFIVYDYTLNMWLLTKIYKLICNNFLDAIAGVIEYCGKAKALNNCVM